MKRLFFAAAAALVATAAVTAVVVRGGFGTSSAEAASPGSGRSAYVVSSNRGPIPPCSGDDCTAANLVWNFIHVINANALDNHIGFTDRTTWPSSFVISTVDQEVFVNGVDLGTFTATPPPNATPLSWSGHWPSTVDCEGQPGSFHTPCDVVLNPAVLPGENTVATYFGFQHSVDEPNGSYVFRYTIHGTLNGAPVDLTASSKAIQMT